MHLTLDHSVPVAPRRFSARAAETAMMFGLDAESAAERALEIIDPCELDLPIPGPAIVFITGPSGGGKSTALRLIARECATAGCRVVSTAALPPLDEDAPIVDAVACRQISREADPDGLADAHAILSLAGLGDAFVMLRSLRELSDGQRARFELARLIDAAGDLSRESTADSRARPVVIIADEFAATLDRLTALTLARCVRRWINRTQHTLIAACAHDDLVDALQPDLLLVKDLDAALRATRCS